MKSFKSTAWLLPQPVLIIGTYDKEGKPNAMNAAWGGQWDMHEIIISLGSHQTTDNLAENLEFTVAFATTETMVASDYVGIVSGRNTPDKMEKTGWTIEKAPNVNAPVFKEFPMTLECLWVDGLQIFIEESSVCFSASGDKLILYVRK